MELDITTDMTALCRVCMIAEPEHLTSLHDTSPCDQPNLYEMLEAICAPVFRKSDVEDIIPDLPNKVCPPCRNAIVAAYQLHQQCIETDRRLSELLALKWELQGPGGEEDFEDSDFVKTLKEEPTPETLDTNVENEIDFSKQDEDFDDEDAQMSSGTEESLLEKAMNQNRTLDMHEEEKADEHHNSAKLSYTGSKLRCSACDKVFSSRNTLSRHLVRNFCDGTNDPKKRTCDICHKVAKSVRMLERHMQMHGLSGSIKYQKAQRFAYSCNICDKKFERKYKLQCHLYGHKEFLTCLNCNKTFKHRSALLFHVKLKRCPIGPGGLQCEKCATTFSSKMSWNKHVEAGNCHQSTFPCTECGKVFDKPTRLYYHMYSHKGRIPCPNCNHTFAHKGGLMEHIKHKRCPKLKNATQEQEVREEKLPEVAGTFPCTFCSKTFDHPTRLQNHLIGHKKRVFCPRCDESFSTKGALRLHLDRKRCRMLQKVPAVSELQTQEEPKEELKSKDCNKTISSNKEKQKRRQKMDRFPCTICGKTFDKRSQLSYHKATHRERAVCSRCNQTFITSGALRTHIVRNRCPMLKNTPNEMYVARSEMTELHPQEESKEELKRKDCNTKISTKKAKRKCRQTPESFPCTICGKTFDKRSKLSYHKVSHKERAVCLRCNQTFITSAALRTHIDRKRCPKLKNTPNGMYVARSENLRVKEDAQCDKCQMAFTSKRALISHIEDQQCNLTAETFTCTVCSKMFDKRTRLQYHMIRHKEPISCPNACGQTFTINTNLQKHIIHKRCPALRTGSFQGNDTTCTTKKENLSEERNQDEENEINEMLLAAERELANENIAEVIVKEEPAIEDFSLAADDVNVKLENMPST